MANKMERFTQRARRVLSLAQEEAERLHHKHIGTEHLLLGLIREEGGVAGRVLREVGVDPRRAEELVERLTRDAPSSTTGPADLSPLTKMALEFALDEARRMGHGYIGTEHLLLGLVRMPEGVSVDVLDRLKISRETIRNQTHKILKESPIQTPSSGQKGQSTQAANPSKAKPTAGMKLFVNYRRDDEATFVELLRTHFMFRYGRENVFMDFDSIPPFTRFEEFIKQKVRESDVVVPIIGSRWLELLREKAISGKTDYVRVELEEALRLGKVIAPVLIQGAGVPSLDDVPPELRPMFGLNVPEISGGRDVLNKVGWLMDHFERALSERGIQRTVANAVGDETLKVVANESLSMDDLLDRFAAAVKAQDYPQALIWAAEMRAAGVVPKSFRLEEREAKIQAELKAIEEARRRKEVAEYLYKFVRRMVTLQDDEALIIEALQEVWTVEPGYDPDGIAPKPA